MNFDFFGLGSSRALAAEVNALRQELDLNSKMDAFVSETLGFGTAEDKSVSDWQYVASPRLTHKTLTALYRGTGIAKRVADHPANEAMREWITINIDRKTADYLNDLIMDSEIVSWFGKALRWARAFRGAVLVLDVDDGQPVDSPVDKSRVRGVFPRFLVDASRAQPCMQDGTYLDPWTKPSHYRVTTTSTALYHADRLLVFDGLDAGDDNRMETGGWGESVYDVINGALRNYCADYALSSALLKDQSVMVFKREGWDDAVKKKGARYALKQIRARKRMVSAVHGLLMDAGEQFEFVNRNLAGTADVARLSKDFLCAQTGIPHSELFNESPGANLGEGGAYQSRSFYNMVRIIQAEGLAPNIRKYLWLQHLAHINRPIKLPEVVPFQFRSLWQMTPKEMSEIYDRTASADFKYWQMEVLDAPAIQTRFYAAGFSQDIVMEDQASAGAPTTPTDPKDP